MNTKNNVAVIGLWHLGSISAACLAEHGNKVVGIDPSREVIANFVKGKPPIYEPGLEELVKECSDKGNLSFSNDMRSVSNADYILMAFDTPINEDDTPDLSPILKSVDDSIPYLQDGVLMLVRSQVPIGTCDEIKSRISKKRPSLKFGIVCIPENLKLGEAISGYRNPDFLVIGSDTEEDFKKAEKLFGFVKTPVLKMNLRSAEMTKHALNAFLACEISFANEIGNLSDTFNADSFKVMEALHLDKRIGKNALLKPGLGFAGGTLARDVGVLRALGKKNGTDTEMLNAIIGVNLEQNKVIAKKLKALFGQLKGLTIGVLGLTYKPGTSAIRRSASINIIKELVKSGATVKAYDPKAEFEMAKVGVSFERCSKASDTADSSHALLLLTSWPEFKELDYHSMKQKMLKPVIIDAQNMLDPEEMKNKGFLYIGIGRGGQIKKLPPEVFG